MYLAHEDIVAQLVVGTLNLGRQAPFETGQEARYHPHQLDRRTIAGKYQLLVALMQVVEYMEKGILRLGLPGKLLDIVHQQHIDALVETDKVVYPVVADGIGILYQEIVCRQIEYPCSGIILLDAQANGLNQVGLPYPRLAKEEEGVEGVATGIGGNRLGSSTRQHVACPLIVAFKSVNRVQAGVELIIYALLERVQKVGHRLLHLLDSSRFGRGRKIDRSLGLTDYLHTIYQLYVCPVNSRQNLLQQVEVVLLNLLYHEM